MDAMNDDPGVSEFDERAESYDRGMLGNWHGEITQRVGVVVERSAPDRAHRLLDVGCGTGLLLEQLSGRLGPSWTLDGVDAAPRMVERATARSEGRFTAQQGRAEQLVIADASYDVVVASLSFDHWADQEQGLRECARVLRPGGTLVVADLFSWWLAFTVMRGKRRGRIRTPRQLIALCLRVGLEPLTWQQLERIGPLPVVQALVADRPLH
jgi:ubiquinone/menaquinone biosynthesis C-methylase UbiE